MLWRKYIPLYEKAVEKTKNAPMETTYKTKRKTEHMLASTSNDIIVGDGEEKFMIGFFYPSRLLFQFNSHI